MPNQYTKGRTQKGDVFGYVLANPDCTSGDIARATGVQFTRTCQYLAQMEHDGLLVRVKYEGERSARWSAAGGEFDDSPIRRFVKEWICTTKRNAFECYLFGAAA